MDIPSDFHSRIPEYRVRLETFDGPLDLLLHLVKEKDLDIFAVSLAPITEEFLAHVRAAQEIDLGTAGDYLVVASSLIRLKSKALLPREESPEDETEEPVDDEELLRRRLQEYERFRGLAEMLRTHELETQSRFRREPSLETGTSEDEENLDFFEVDIYDLYSAFKRVMEEIESRAPREIVPEEFTVDEKMAEIVLILNDQDRFNLPVYLMACRSRLEVIVIFLALLELIRQGKVRARQTHENGEIWLFRTDQASD